MFNMLFLFETVKKRILTDNILFKSNISLYCEYVNEILSSAAAWEYLIRLRCADNLKDYALNTDWLERKKITNLLENKQIDEKVLST